MTKISKLFLIPILLLAGSTAFANTTDTEIHVVTLGGNRYIEVNKIGSTQTLQINRNGTDITTISNSVHIDCGYGDEIADKTTILTTEGVDSFAQTCRQTPPPEAQMLLDASPSGLYTITEISSGKYWTFNTAYDGIGGYYYVTNFVDHSAGGSPAPTTAGFFDNASTSFASLPAGIAGIISGTIDSIWPAILLIMGTILGFFVLVELQDLIMAPIKEKKGRK